MNKFGIFTLNLARSPERREHFMGQAKKASIEFEFFDAVDGLGKDVSEFASYNREKRINKFYYDMKPTEIACYLSHYNCIKAAYDKGMEKVVIFEDDISFGENFKHVLDYCLALDKRFEMIRLYGLKKPKSIKLAEIGFGYNLIIPLNTMCSATGYVLNRQGMKKVLDYGSQITAQFDIMIDRYWENGLSIFAVDPNPIVDVFAGASTIVEAPQVDKWRAKGHLRQRLGLKMGKMKNSVLKRLYNLAIILRAASGQFKV